MTEPTRERVAAYEAALGCKRWSRAVAGKSGCSQHYRAWFVGDALGCPVAVTWPEPATTREGDR